MTTITVSESHGLRAGDRLLVHGSYWAWCWRRKPGQKALIWWKAFAWWLVDWIAPERWNPWHYTEGPYFVTDVRSETEISLGGSA